MLASPAMRRRLRAVILLSFPLVLALPVAPARAASTGSNLDVEMLDNVFAPRIVRIPVGGTVEWTNEGRSRHNVTADDGAFASADLAPGEAFDETFSTEGAYPYFCSIHGSPGAGMTGLVLVGDAPIPGAASDVGPGRETPPSLPGAEIRVPQDAPTIQAAVDSAEPGGIVVISPGSAASTAAWIVGSSCGTRISAPGSEGGVSRPGPTSDAAPGIGASPTSTRPVIPAPGEPWIEQK